ncbi:putative ribonuclease H-like domain-containing protein [Tanacetum coccineum]
MVDAHLGTRLGDSIQKALRSYTVEFKKKAQAEKERYIGLIEKSVKDIINDEVKTQLPQILPKAVSNFATPPQSTYEAASSLTEFELKKILIDKMEKSQSNLTVDEHKELYKALVNPYNIDKDLFLVYGKAVSLKRGREDKDKDEGPPARSDQEMKRRKTRKDVESLKGQDMGNTDDQPNVEAAPKYDWFKKPERPPTPDSDWNVRKSVDFRPPQTWISKIAQAEKPPLSFDELMSTPIDFSAYVMNHLKIDNLTQDHLVGPAFNLLNGTCKSLVELEYNIEECYKAVTNRLDWNNPKGKKYPFDLSKPLSLIMDRGRQVVPVDYFINNNLEYLRGGSSSRKYTTSTTKTKAAKYDIQGIRDMVPSLWSPVKCMARSSTKELFTPFENPEREFSSSIKLFKTPSLDESSSPEFDLLSDLEEHSEEEVTGTMMETMEDGSDHEDANEHIEKVLEIVDLFHIPNITQDQIMLRAFPMSLTGAASRWLKNKPSGSITTCEDLKAKFLSKYCPPARSAKKIKEINNFL